MTSLHVDPAGFVPRLLQDWRALNSTIQLLRSTDWQIYSDAVESDYRSIQLLIPAYRSIQYSPGGRPKLQKDVRCMAQNSEGFNCCMALITKVFTCYLARITKWFSWFYGPTFRRDSAAVWLRIQKDSSNVWPRLKKNSPAVWPRFQKDSAAVWPRFQKDSATVRPKSQ